MSTRTWANLISLSVFLVIGYNDIGYHKPDIISPNMDTLASQGIILEQNYVQAVCSPSRSALMTGMYPFHLGRQGRPLEATQPTGLTLEKKLLPEYLGNMGYSTKMIGKWHLGFCKEDFLPTRRGFDSYHGFYNGYETYYTKMFGSKQNFGYNFMDDLDTQFDANGTYSTHLYTQIAEDIITTHAKESGEEKPLFLYVAYQATHSPLEVPKQYADLYPGIESKDRRLFSGMVTAMDESIGNITQSLKDNGLYENTIIIFIGDNGGDIPGFGPPPRDPPPFGCGNNYPLRGFKGTNWEGGVRTPGFIHSPLLATQGAVSHEMIHITDWLPTLYRLAGASQEEVDALDIDGMNQGNLILDGEKSRRTKFVVNIETDHFGKLVGAYRKGEFKINVNPDLHRDGWIEPPTSSETPVVSTNDNNTTNKREDVIFLFNVMLDPEERHDLAFELPHVVKELMEEMMQLADGMVEADEPEVLENVGVVDGVWVTGWC